MPVMAPTIEDALAPIRDGIMLAVPREVAGVPIDMVSTGPDREETIVLRHPFE